MRVFVTGGTGFVGLEVVSRLRSAGHTVRLLVRDPDSPRATALAARCGTELHPGDAISGSGLDRGMARIDAVIHLVGIIGEVGRATYENAHVRATENVLQAAHVAGVKRFVHMSALGTRPGAASRYHQTKWVAEERVRGSGLEWTIHRPSLIYGPGDKFVNLFATLSRWSPIVPVVGSGEGKLQPVSVGDVAACFVGALLEPRATGRVFDVCGAEAMSFNEMLGAILSVTRRRRLLLHIPLPLARLQASLLEWLYPRLLRRAPPLNRDQILMLQEDNVGNPRPAKDLFGLTLVSFREALQAWLCR